MRLPPTTPPLVEENLPSVYDITTKTEGGRRNHIYLVDADGHWTTRILDEMAQAHLIPVISGGTRPDTDDGVLKDTSRSPITVSAPGLPCFRCCIQYLPSEARKERGCGREPGPDFNIDRPTAVGGSEGDDEPAPWVLSLNEIVTDPDGVGLCLS